MKFWNKLKEKFFSKIKIDFGVKKAAILEDAKGKKYFVVAKNWADDMYTEALISRNRYKIAFYIAMGLALFLAFDMSFLIPAQHMEPLLINHYEDGRVSVLPLKQSAAPINQSQTESEIVRYVVSRESFDPVSFSEQYSLVNLMSADDVAQSYGLSQSAANKNSPISVLGNGGYRTVHVDNVVFLDSKAENKGKPQKLQTHKNLAQVSFTITDHTKDSGSTKTTPFIALVSWAYHGTPVDPDDMWKNWDGFTVTQYTLQQSNTGNKNES